MNADANTQKLKELAAKKKPVNALKAAPSKQSSLVTQIKKQLPAVPNRRTMVDIALFSAAVYVVVNHGKEIAKMFEGLTPTEEQIMEMMQQQQPQMMPPPPM